MIKSDDRKITPPSRSRKIHLDTPFYLLLISTMPGGVSFSSLTTRLATAGPATYSSSCMYTFASQDGVLAGYLQPQSVIFNLVCSQHVCTTANQNAEQVSPWILLSCSPPSRSVKEVFKAFDDVTHLQYGVTVVITADMASASIWTAC